MFHTIIVVGNLGKDPEMRYTPSGQAVTTFSIASNRQYTNNNGQSVKETIWFRNQRLGQAGRVCKPVFQKRLQSPRGRPLAAGPQYRQSAHIYPAGRHHRSQL